MVTAASCLAASCLNALVLLAVLPSPSQAYSSISVWLLGSVLGPQDVRKEPLPTHCHQPMGLMGSWGSHMAPYRPCWNDSKMQVILEQTISRKKPEWPRLPKTCRIPQLLQPQKPPHLLCNPRTLPWSSWVKKAVEAQAIPATLLSSDPKRACFQVGVIFLNHCPEMRPLRMGVSLVKGERERLRIEVGI